MKKRLYEPSQFGVNLSWAEFFNRVGKLFPSFQGGRWVTDGRWSTEGLMHHPDDAKAFCELAREKAGLAGAPDHAILHGLSHYRKHPEERT